MSGMEYPSFDVPGFLDEPGRPASVATITGRGHPALAMMWFIVREDRLWFHTPGGSDPPSPFLQAAAGCQEVAVMIATFDPPDDVRQVRMTGPARLEATDDGRVRRLYRRYVGSWTPGWEGQATSPGYQPVVDVAATRHGRGLPRAQRRPDLPVVGTGKAV